MKLISVWLTSLSLLMAAGFTLAGSGLPADEASVSADSFPKRPYSPPAGRGAIPTQVFWGDTHLHTSFSMDAGAFGARLDPVDAYRFAKGEELISSTGQQVKLLRPLDFLVVADHSDNMGFFPRLVEGDPDFLANDVGRQWYNMIQEGGQTAVKVAVDVIERFSRNTIPPALMSLPGSEAYGEAWKFTYDAAEGANDPGNFSAFIGWEWTSNTNGNNLHRVVIYRDGADKASQMEPYTTLPPAGSDNPVDLWKWLASYEKKTGGRILAIAHNGNLSNGIMFPEIDSFTKRRVSKQYVTERARWEPLYEVTQIKGDGEAHPLLSTDDEFADYGTWDQGNLDLSTPKEDDMLQWEYARSALQTGMRLEEKFGVNPYKFGMIGSTDSHTGLATADSDNFFGKHSGAEPNPGRPTHPMAQVSSGARYEGWDMLASGYAAVWARENTRESIFKAMQRKEVYATTGPRIMVRFFGGWEFEARDATSRLPADIGYAKGVPMGGDLHTAPNGKSPSFLVGALRDPVGANLDRIQIVKVWNEKGKPMEKVYDVVWSDRRVMDASGKLPAVGNTVDVANATWSNSIGASELITVWEDPDFDPAVRASYYARVLEIPTPNWTAYDAKYFKLDLPEQVPMVQQERAYTSPIWYNP